MADIIQLRRDTLANWASANPTLAQGELGIETDTGKFKLGTGATAWNSLGYYSNVSNNLSNYFNFITNTKRWGTSTCSSSYDFKNYSGNFDVITICTKSIWNGCNCLKRN